MAKNKSWENNDEIKLFQEYLRIPSVQPDVDYTKCVEFLTREANSIGLPVKLYCPGGPTKPIVVMTWVGTQPELPSIILNSHMDVVPVFEDHWTHPPFAAEIDSEGRIYARGSQDMKCVGMQYLAAVRALKKKGVTLKRTLHLCYVPDEEIGGKTGMALFVHTNEFKALNSGFSLDEGLASSTDTYSVYYAERAIWHVFYKITGTAGHGSIIHKNTVGVKFNYILNKMNEFRACEDKRLEKNSNLTIGDVTTINLTIINAGVQSNVVPPLLTACFDVRIANDVDHKELEKTFLKWCEEAGGGITIEYEQKEPKVAPTKIDGTNAFWLAFRDACAELGLKIKTQVFTGGTDSRYIRGVGIPAIGFSPMINLPILLHDNDEYLTADSYLNGIELYKTIIPKVANV